MQGYQGYQGNLGSQGYQGNLGSQGYQGIDGGYAGMGYQGYQGYQGNQGSQGYQGNQGIDGAYAGIGYQGYQGNQGSQGYQGNQGIDGAYAGIGYQGYQGNQGPQGFCYCPSPYAIQSLIAAAVLPVLPLNDNITYENAIDEAYLNKLVILEPIISDIIINIPDKSTPDGQILRLHHHNNYENTAVYIITDKNGNILIKIGANQSYSLIWREKTSDWVIIQGIINITN